MLHLVETGDGAAFGGGDPVDLILRMVILLKQQRGCSTGSLGGMAGLVAIGTAVFSGLKRFYVYDVLAFALPLAGACSLLFTSASTPGPPG